MEMNYGLGIIYCILIALSCISLVLLKITNLRPYFIDTALISFCMGFCAAAYFTGHALFYLGIFLYLIKLKNLDIILKFIVLFSGIGLGYLTSNNFYSYTSAITLAIFTVIRMVESIIEVSLWQPEKNEAGNMKFDS